LKHEFIAIVSHDLRTPLASIDVFHQLLEHGNFGALSQDGGKALSMARRSAARLLNLVKDLLDFERLESGQMSLSFNPCDSLTITTASLEAVRGFADAQQISLVVEDKQHNLIADEDRLVQVLVNLLSNAVKFSPRGETVKVCVEESPEKIRW